MTTTSSTPMTVDGVRLDTYAWNIETLDGRLRMPGVRGDQPIVPGDDGYIYVPNKSYEEGIVTLKMWVRGCDVNGAIPGGSSQMGEFRKNLDKLTRMFGVKHRLLDIRQTYPAGDIQWMAEVTEGFDLSASAVNPKAGFAVVLRVPDTFARDVNTADYTSAAALTPATTLTMSTYSGSVAPIRDAILVVRGPATNPKLTNPDTGEWVQYTGTIASGTDWRIDCGTWDTRTGSAIGLAGAGGTAQVAETSYGGGGARFMSLTTTDSQTSPQIRLDGSSFGAATQVLARARRKFYL